MMRHCYADNWPPKGGRSRFKDQRECLCWWAWVPHNDNPQWLCGQAMWTVDPYTGHAFKRAAELNPNMRPFLKAPHRSYWRAIGTFDNHCDRNIGSKHDGAWQSDNERVHAYGHPDYFTEEQASNQIPAYTVGNRGQRIPSAGRAASKRAPSLRRPQRPFNDR